MRIVPRTRKPPERHTMTSPVRSARAISAIPVALLCACGSVPVRVPVMRPAEINMVAYQSVAVGEMRGRGNAIMRELSLSASDLADPSKAAKLGKVMTAGALIYGDVDEQYREVPSEDRIKNKDGTITVIYKLRGETRTRATFKIVDVATGRLIIAKTYEERRDDTNSGYNKRPEPIDRDALERSARRGVLERFMRAIVPHQEYVTASFQKDSDIPQLEGGIGWAERGDWKKAQATFSQAIADGQKNPKIKSEQLAKAYWNLGLAYEYAGDYDGATATVQKAYELSNDKDMLRELDNIRRLQDEAKRVSEQTAASLVGGAQ